MILTEIPQYFWNFAYFFVSLHGKKKNNGNSAMIFHYVCIYK